MIFSINKYSKFISDSFDHMLNSQIRKKNTDFLCFITDFTAGNAPLSVTYEVTDEVRSLNLYYSKLLTEHFIYMNIVGFKDFSFSVL